MASRTKNIMLIILIVVLSISLIFNLMFYKSNSDLQEKEYSEFNEMKNSLIKSTNGYIEALEQLSKSEEFDSETLKLLSATVLTSINEQHQKSLMVYWHISSEDAFDKYHSEYIDLWGYLTNYSEVNTQDDLDSYLRKLKRHFEGFKKDVKKF